jgi:DNA polymerase III epsilon subunit-like protein
VDQGENMDYIMVYIESDGPIPGDYSMISIGAVRISHNAICDSIYLQLKPISGKYNPDSLRICGFTREEALQFPSASKQMFKFLEWLKKSDSKIRFVSDNNGFDWMFICWYLIHFTGENPFGYTSMNLGSLYKGIARDLNQNFKHLRETLHSHNALDDAMGNAEAFIKIINGFQLEI